MIATFAPISLDHLVADAELLTRVDRKYLLPASLLPDLLARLPRDARVLEIDGRRDFGYRSVYFDTERLDSYLGAAHRRRRRFKVRIRTYLDTGARFVEIKTRGSRGTTIKTRFPYDGSGHDLGPAGRAHLDHVLTGAHISPDGHTFQPVLATGYRRHTLYLPGCGSRVTVDTDLTWSLPDGATLGMPGHVVLETKSGGGVSEVDRLLWRLRHRPASISKYATGLAALRPELPANRWHPILHRHFSLRNRHETA
ncbi:VTC domain-containing protein [Actinoplanes ianthinogenes]|uniref:VTC domain-containing protein n=1 Tax=Actinoplanes ianthinogenes TaxID=122358 RepID=A0ABM7LM75_9ACTN|nr:polyphosphate polymerase domain-containing protein [Actinoplanes ianthinogenes]BCJ40293.1 VTC domain-containing protein [Actinoplanes ianthinogenes]GGR11398.1 VTC domain-containing protein [Actinoplanes ianthinogenes]